MISFRRIIRWVLGIVIRPAYGNCSLRRSTQKPQFRLTQLAESLVREGFKIVSTRCGIVCHVATLVWQHLYHNPEITSDSHLVR
jgi:hypothetical protein